MTMEHNCYGWKSSYFTIVLLFQLNKDVPVECGMCWDNVQLLTEAKHQSTSIRIPPPPARDDVRLEKQNMLQYRMWMGVGDFSKVVVATFSHEGGSF